VRAENVRSSSSSHKTYTPATPGSNRVSLSSLILNESKRLPNELGNNRIDHLGILCLWVVTGSRDHCQFRAEALSDDVSLGLRVTKIRIAVPHYHQHRHLDLAETRFNRLVRRVGGGHESPPMPGHE